MIDPMPYRTRVWDELIRLYGGPKGIERAYAERYGITLRSASRRTQKFRYDPTMTPHDADEFSVLAGLNPSTVWSKFLEESDGEPIWQAPSRAARARRRRERARRSVGQRTSERGLAAAG